MSEQAERPAHVTQLAQSLRRTMVVVGALLFVSGVPTLLLSGSTDEHFAWTIQPPLTAAFMGAGYWSTVLLVLLAARESAWANARIAVPSAVVFSVFTLAATFMHFDRFHEDRPITWAWVGIYIVVPALFVVFAARQVLVRGIDPPRTAPLAPWARVLLVAEALLVVPFGLALFIDPGTVDGAWPWALTPLTGRIVAAWLIGLGVGALHAVVENDWHRILPALATSAVFAILQFVNLARYADTPDWSEPSTWAYVAVLLTMLGIGLAGLRRAWLSMRGSPRGAPASARP